MNEAEQNDASQPQQASPPPIPSAPADAKKPPVALVFQFLTAHFWWVVGGAAGVKLISYFVSPTRNATTGYHFVKLMIGFVSYGAILALIAFIISKCVKSKRDVFRIAFAILFAVACLLDVPTAIMRSKANAAVENLAKSHAAFEALMKYQTNPIWLIPPDRYSAGVKKTPRGDGDKYFILSYCYANGYDGHAKDVGKAVQLCQMAASEYNFTAQSILKKAGFSWQKKKRRY